MSERTPDTQQPAPEGGGLLRIRLRLAYDGTDFAGWAQQPGQRTVQGELTAAVDAVLRVPEVRVVVAGRTDSGVHALGQVCHFDVPIQAWPGSQAGIRRLNAVLPADIRVFGADVAPADFDARFSALWRRYEYLVSDSGRLDPRARHAVLSQRRAFDVEAMHAAAQVLVGEHDFAAFCRARPGASSVRTILSLSVMRRADPRDPQLIVIEISADAFCHSMVRSVVGALLAVGQGRLTPDGLQDVLAGARRVPVVATVSAHGLALVDVGYPQDDLAGRQAVRARRYRG